MIWFILGLIYANFAEWTIHKYILHKLGKKKKNMWNFHWKEHHKNAKRCYFFDFDYLEPFSKWNAKTKEIVGLLFLAATHIPLLYLVPPFVIATYIHIVVYYFVHRWAHLNPESARSYLKWHWDHHMGSNQDANWCVTYPLADYILGTRIKCHETMKKDF